MDDDKKTLRSGNSRVLKTIAAMGAAIFTPGRASLQRAFDHQPLSPRDDYQKPNSHYGPEPLPPTRIYPPMPRAVVSIAGARSSIEDAVREAVAAAGGIEEIERGQTVMIKPNITAPTIRDYYPGRITTNPEVVRALIRLVKERGAHALVGDRGFTMSELAFHSTGFAKVCKQEGAEAMPWNRSEYKWFFPHQRHWSNGFRVPIALTRADHFINVPVLKNHESTNAEFTCCLKAFVGVCHPDDRHQRGPNALHRRNISEKIAELNLAATPLINVVDATQIMVRGGPGDGLMQGDLLYRNGVWREPNLIIASRDRVACDSLALATLKRYGADLNVDRPYVTKSVWDQTQIHYAAELGIGQAEPAMITIEDVKVQVFDEIKDNWV